MLSDRQHRRPFESPRAQIPERVVPGRQRVGRSPREGPCLQRQPQKIEIVLAGEESRIRNVRRYDCPASWVPLDSDGSPAGGMLPALPRYIQLYESSTAIVAFKTHSGHLVVLDGAKGADNLYHLSTNGPYFEARFVAQIDAENQFATGIIETDWPLAPTVWQARVDVFRLAPTADR